MKTLENPIETAAPAPAEPQDYVDLAFTAISRKMKDTLNKNEIMDVVEEIEAIVNRVCREKRRRMDLTGQQAPPPPPVTVSMSTDTLFGGGPGHRDPWQYQLTMSRIITTFKSGMQHRFILCLTMSNVMSLPGNCPNF